MSAAVPLAHALVDRLAEQLGVPVLAVKGPSLAAHGLRERGASSDADVLVIPGREHDLIAALEAVGWEHRFERSMPYILERHSIPLLHRDWPCDIDVHWYFPGLHASPSASFAALWKHRQTLEVAGQPVTSLDLAASALIGATHCMRHPNSLSKQGELDEIVQRMLEASDEDRQALLGLAVQTRSITVLQPFLSRIGLTRQSDDLNADERDRWLRYTMTHDQGSAGAWLEGLQHGNLWARITTLFRALWPSNADIDAEMSTLTQPTSRTRFRTERLARGMRSLRPVIRTLVRLRR